MKKRVLIVDDVASMRLLLRYFIEKEDYVIVAEAANGVEAVEQYCEHRPDITIMDIDMPFKSGFQAAQEILAESNDARIIFCSGSMRKHELPGLQLGKNASCIVPKPFVPAQLYQAMQM